MGVKAEVGFDKFPEQGSFLGITVQVCFNYDSSRTMLGEIVRDDAQGPIIIKLEDGRYVLGTECQYRPVG